MHHSRRGRDQHRQLLRAIAALIALCGLVCLAAPAAAATSPTVTRVEGGCTLAGGGSITVTGTNLLTAATARLGGTDKVASVSPSSSTSATVICPPQPFAGFYELTINASGEWSPTYLVPYSDAGRAAVAHIVPARGPLAGGTTVTITGTGFEDDMSVRFGGATASCSGLTSAQATCTSPGSTTEGAVDVVVVTSRGPSFYSDDDRFTYTSGPSIASITPASAPASGSPVTSVTITGTNLAHATDVSFGSTTYSADDFVATDTTIQLVLSAKQAPDIVDVSVTTPDGTATAPDIFRFVGTAAPKITAITPVKGPAGTVVSITGSGFAALTSVTFDAIPAPAMNTTSDTSLTAAVPVGLSAGLVDVSVVTSNGTATKTDAFTVEVAGVPSVTTVSPKTGSAQTTVVLLGSGFSNATKVTFDGIDATFTINSDTSITATAPYGMSQGDVDVVVSNAAGPSLTTADTVFTNAGGGATLTVVLQGRFSLVAWVGGDGMAVGDALKGGPNGPHDGTTDVTSQVSSVWSYDSATGKWLGYFPSAANTPGVNDLTTLKFGGGYFIGLTNPGASGSVDWVVERGSV